MTKKAPARSRENRGNILVVKNQNETDEHYKCRKDAAHDNLRKRAYKTFHQHELGKGSGIRFNGQVAWNDDQNKRALDAAKLALVSPDWDADAIKWQLRTVHKNIWQKKLKADKQLAAIDKRIKEITEEKSTTNDDSESFDAKALRESMLTKIKAEAKTKSRHNSSRARVIHPHITIANPLTVCGSL